MDGKNYLTTQWKHYYKGWICEDDVSLLCWYKTYNCITINFILYNLPDFFYYYLLYKLSSQKNI